jgi:hypothetical protein
MAKKTVNFDVVREIAVTLPGVEESTMHGAPSLKVRELTELTRELTR